VLDLSHALERAVSLSAGASGALLLLVILPFFVVFTWKAQHGWRPALRRIAVYERLKHLVSQAAEAGQPMHVAIGSASLAGLQSSETLAGLAAFDFVAQKASVWGQPVVATAGDGASLLVAQGLLRSALDAAGYSEQYRVSSLQYSGPDPLAYAAGAAELAEQRQVLGTLLLGHFGPEGLLLAEAGAAEDRTQIGGAALPDGAALLHAALDESVQGEEVLAAGAYLHRPSHLGSLAAEDLLRAAVVAAIVVGGVLASLGILS